MVYISLREVINLFKLLQTVIITLYCESKAWEFLIFGIIYWSCPWFNSNLIRKTVINILLWIFFLEANWLLFHRNLYIFLFQWVFSLWMSTPFSFSFKLKTRSDDLFLKEAKQMEFLDEEKCPHHGSNGDPRDLNAPFWLWHEPSVTEGSHKLWLPLLLQWWLFCTSYWKENNDNKKVSFAAAQTPLRKEKRKQEMNCGAILMLWPYWFM